MFTVDPTTRDYSNILIEATVGLGEALVGGSIIPDRLWVNKSTLEIVKQQIGSKKRIVLRNPIGGGVIQMQTPEGQERKLCLAIEEVRKIAEFGRRIEAHFGRPEDIEWAISEGEVYILQARPVTGL